MLILILVVFGPPIMSLLLVAVAAGWKWLAIFGGTSAAIVVAEFVWALSMSDPKSQALFGQHAILWGSFLLFGLIGKAVSLFLEGRAASRWQVSAPVVLGFLLPVALIFALQINTLFW